VTLLSVGTCSITASQNGSAIYAVATPVTESFLVRLAQAIVFGPLADVTLSAPPFTISASASSGLSVSFASSIPSVCTVSGAIVTPVAAGQCSILASQAGNTTFAAAAPVTRNFNIIGPTISGVHPASSALNAIQPGSWASIYGSGLASTAANWNNDFPASLGHVTVTINAKSAYLSYVSPTQINLQAPDDSTAGNVNVVVTNSNGSATSTVQLAPMSPSFILFDDGKHVAGYIPTPNGTGAYGGGTYDVVGPVGAFPFSTRPVKPSEILILYGVGFGPTNPPVPAGSPFSGAAPTINSVAFTVGGVPAYQWFSGISEAGLYQFNITVPNVGSGDQVVQATVNGEQTLPGPLVAVQ